MLGALLARLPCAPPPVSGGAALRPRRGARRHAPVRAAVGGSSGGGDDAELQRALSVGVPEARALLKRATRLAEAATRQELLDSLPSLDAPGTPPPGGAQLAREGLVRAWREEGLSVAEAERVASACEAAGGRLCTGDGAAAKLSQLRRLLPGVDVVRLVARDDRVLTRTQAAQVVQNLTVVAIAMQRVDPVGLLASHPPLLWCEDMEAKLTLCLARLRVWTRGTSDVELLLEANPQLVERVPAYYAQAEFFQLPLEIQNMMVVGGGGGGVVYRSWGGFEDRNTD
jgi:hypothetical protein